MYNELILNLHLRLVIQEWHMQAVYNLTRNPLSLTIINYHISDDLL